MIEWEINVPNLKLEADIILSDIMWNKLVWSKFTTYVWLDICKASFKNLSEAIRWI